MVADTIPDEGATPRGAFARALIVPGWGHFSIGANRRGAVFVALQGASWFMLVKTITKLGRANDNLDVFEGIATDSLITLMANDPAAAERLSDSIAFAEAVAQHPLVADTRGLVGAREEQRQDWITYTLFFTMASAVDAYVAAYLRDFPVDASVTAQRDGAVSGAARSRNSMGRMRYTRVGLQSGVGAAHNAKPPGQYVDAQLGHTGRLAQLSVDLEVQW